MLEENMGGVSDNTGNNGSKNAQNPFSHNKPQDKKDSKTPALDFF
jgi:hypothetical protein